MDAELRVVRWWRSREAHFVSARHAATAMAAYLLWKNPAGHMVKQPLTRDECEQLIARVSSADAGAIDDRDGHDDFSSHGVDADESAFETQGKRALNDALDSLGKHAPPTHVDELVCLLARWFEVGDGCYVASHAPPRLVGVVPAQLQAVWGRAPSLYELGILTHEYRRLRMPDDDNTWSPGAF